MLEQRPDLATRLEKLRARFDIVGAGPTKWHVDDAVDLRRARRQHKDAIAEIKRLFNAVCHEYHCLLLLLPDSQQFVLQ